MIPLTALTLLICSEESEDGEADPTQSVQKPASVKQADPHDCIPHDAGLAERKDKEREKDSISIFLIRTAYGIDGPAAIDFSDDEGQAFTLGFIDDCVVVSEDQDSGGSLVMIGKSDGTPPPYAALVMDDGQMTRSRDIDPGDVLTCYRHVLTLLAIRILESK